MKPIKPRWRKGWIKGCLAKQQPPYLPLDYNAKGDCVETLWALTWPERIRLLFTGRLHLAQLTFGRLFQPVKPSVVPFEEKDLLK